MTLRYGKTDGIHIVSPQAKQQNDQCACCHRVGERVPVSGIYCAFHDNHRLSHEVTLLAGHVFPRCNQCSFAVHFVLVAAAPAAIEDRDFRIQLYEIPHPIDAAAAETENIA